MQNFLFKGQKGAIQDQSQKEGLTDNNSNLKKGGNQANGEKDPNNTDSVQLGSSSNGGTQDTTSGAKSNEAQSPEHSEEPSTAKPVPQVKKGIPTVIPEILPPTPETEKLPPVEEKPPEQPGLAAKLSEFASQASETSAPILSMGKDLIFKKFGL